MARPAGEATLVAVVENQQASRLRRGAARLGAPPIEGFEELGDRRSTFRVRFLPLQRAATAVHLRLAAGLAAGRAQLSPSVKTSALLVRESAEAQL